MKWISAHSPEMVEPASISSAFTKITYKVESPLLKGQRRRKRHGGVVDVNLQYPTLKTMRNTRATGLTE
jgi:hypothetical protein